MSVIHAEGNLKKMQAQLIEGAAEYQLVVGNELIPLQSVLGKKIKLSYSGLINCIHCQRKTNKSFGQGHCYPCFKKLAQCDSCIMSPEKCHYFAGTCRDPAWADEYCMQDHFVYLANSSGIKIGITRGSQIPTRWIDQGAIQALPVFRVSNRLQSGLVEILFKKFIADKTNWRVMLKGDIDLIDLEAQRDNLLAIMQEQINELQQRVGLQNIQAISNAVPVSIKYPVLEYPTKINSLNMDKQPEIEGILLGVKGQYLIFDIGVINIRKYSAYHVRVSCEVE